MLTDVYIRMMCVRWSVLFVKLLYGVSSCVVFSKVECGVVRLWVFSGVVRYIRVRQFFAECGVFIYWGLAHLNILDPLGKYFA